jgi:RNA polymerase sigma-70 factor (ECF subfamily)
VKAPALGLKGGYASPESEKMPMRLQTQFADTLLAEIPRLRAYARLMTNDGVKADQEVEETLKRALANEDCLHNRRQLHVGLFTILRNLLAHDHNLRHADVHDNPSASLETANKNVRITEPLGSVLLLLGFEDREAVILSVAVGFSDLEIAGICGCELEMVSLRVCRGLARLAEVQRNSDENHRKHASPIAAGGVIPAY